MTDDSNSRAREDPKKLFYDKTFGNVEIKGAELMDDALIMQALKETKDTVHAVVAAVRQDDAKEMARIPELKKMGFQPYGMLSETQEWVVCNKSPMRRAMTATASAHMILFKTVAADKTESPNATFCVIRPSGLVSRLLPGINAEQTGLLAAGDHVECLEKSGAWFRHKRGWSMMRQGNDYFVGEVTPTDKKEEEARTVTYVLLVLDKNRGRGRLVFPGGGVDMGEFAYQTALRELREETGLSLSKKDVEDHKIVRQVFKVERVQANRFGANDTMHYFINDPNAKIEGELKAQRSELLWCGWVPLEDVMQRKAVVIGEDTVTIASDMTLDLLTEMSHGGLRRQKWVPDFTNKSQLMLLDCLGMPSDEDGTDDSEDMAAVAFLGLLAGKMWNR